MDRRFMALRVTATIFKVLAWLVLIFGLLGAVGVLVAGLLFRSQPGMLGLDISGPLAGISAFVVVLILSILNFLLLYAGGEFIYLFLSMEENTRRVAYLSQQQYMAQQAPYATPPPSSLDFED
jgi:H+/Cl- antiporter ClcA